MHITLQAGTAVQQGVSTTNMRYPPRQGYEACCGLRVQADACSMQLTASWGASQQVNGRQTGAPLAQSDSQKQQHRAWVAGRQGPT